MGRLFVLFFLLPWWAYVPASVGVIWLGERVYEHALETEAEKAAALETPAPEPVDIGSFDRDRDIHAAREVNVVGLIDHDLDYELVEHTNGVPTTTRYLSMIFGAEQVGSTEVRAALMLDKREEAQFLEAKADEWSIGATADHRVYAFNGFATRSTTLDAMADDAIEEQGLTKAENFIYIAPFFEGRAAALAPHGVPQQSRHIGWALAAAVVLIGVVKRVRSVRKRSANGAHGEVDLTGGLHLALTPATPPEPALAPSDALPQGVFGDTPLGWLARKNAPPAVAVQNAPPADSTNGDRAPDAAAWDRDEDFFGARPAQARSSGSDAHRDDDPEAARGPGVQQQAATGPQPTSATAFYAKLALAMLVVGTLAYDPSLLTASLPIGGIAAFWFGLYIAFKRLRNGARQIVDRVTPTPQHTRRPDRAAQPVATGVGGQSVDLAGPIRSARRERGVI